jgi:4-hydroxybenzoate polyprenyltransferase
MLQKRLHNYLALIRWHSPTGIFLLLWPALTALILASNGQPRALVLFVFLCGAVLMRAAGCIINDLCDVDFDKQVDRTQNRPLAAGQITRIEALLLCAVLLVTALFLVSFLNSYTITLAIVGLILAIIYPLLKRFTHLPQLGLGVAFNWSIPMAFAAQNGHIPLSAWLLYLIGVIWTISYDTMYAMADREDDLQAGVKSTAILFGWKDRTFIALMQGLIIVLLLVLSLFWPLNYWFYSGVFLLLLLFGYQQLLLYDRQPAHCLQAFHNNHWAWFVIFLATYLGVSS